MKIRILAIGSKMPEWVESACADYLQRLRSALPTEIITCPTKNRKHKNAIAKANKEEAEWLWQQCDNADFNIALDRCGKSINTLELAQQIEQCSYSRVNFLIGGPEGITKELLQRCDAIWSLSKLTMAHPIARVVLVEQLFRAHAINTNHPYHR